MQRAKVDLPELTSDFAISDEQATAYREKGFIHLRSVCSPGEVSAYRPIFDAAVERLNTENRPLEERDTYGRAFLQIRNLWREDQDIARYVLARRFAKIAADLMGVDGVRLYHDQALYKEPGGGFTPWHQDRFYWPLDTDHTITMWMPLVDVPAGMEFAVGSHRMRDLRGGAISDDSEAYFNERTRRGDVVVEPVGSLRAGDATFHDGWMLHRAPGNHTDLMRSVMTVIYFADGTRVGAADSEPRRQDLQDWMPGLQPGDLAASPLNPLLFSRASAPAAR